MMTCGNMHWCLLCLEGTLLSMAITPWHLLCIGFLGRGVWATNRTGLGGGRCSGGTTLFLSHMPRQRYQGTFPTFSGPTGDFGIYHGLCVLIQNFAIFPWLAWLLFEHQPRQNPVTDDKGSGNCGKRIGGGTCLGTSNI